MTPEREKELRAVAAGGKMWPLYADARYALLEAFEEIDRLRALYETERRDERTRCVWCGQVTRAELRVCRLCRHLERLLSRAQLRRG